MKNKTWMYVELGIYLGVGAVLLILLESAASLGTFLGTVAVYKQLKHEYGVDE